MPVYLFTHHAYGTWLPDRPRGYVRRHQGLQPTSRSMASRYRSAMKESEALFDQLHQQTLINALIESQKKQNFRCLGAATEATHVHAIIAWDDDREPTRTRALIKSSLSRAMNATFGKRTWLSEGGSRKQVRDHRHLAHLIERYLPKHSGLVWIEDKGFL